MYRRAVVQFSRGKGKFVITLYGGEAGSAPQAVRFARRDAEITAALRHWHVTPDETRYLPACG
jgi:hypothetical protein